MKCKQYTHFQERNDDIADVQASGSINIILDSFLGSL